ncbi:unnamed protein product [Cylicocyclus nassatus]|uniref:Uncharacterized protein n=1 Tax=Cylicocyclus nassatus TaxID=53992 RepID=A0AA36DMC8_CYLNA|nr:unnamed protein product [Cylicocyclus nassatus]
MYPTEPRVEYCIELQDEQGQVVWMPIPNPFEEHRQEEESNTPSSEPISAPNANSEGRPQENTRRATTEPSSPLFGAGARPEEGKDLWFYHLKRRAHEKGERVLEPLPAYSSIDERLIPGNDPRVGCIVCGNSTHRTFCCDADVPFWQRLRLVLEYQLCRRCAEPHEGVTCPSTLRCSKCWRRDDHPTFLCRSTRRIDQWSDDESD